MEGGNSTNDMIDLPGGSNGSRRRWPRFVSCRKFRLDLHAEELVIQAWTCRVLPDQ